jgi:hypothetical protein
MGLSVRLEDENGQCVDSMVVHDPQNLLHRILPPDDAEGWRCVDRIDWYGNTVFNRMQAEDLVRELSVLQKREQDGQTQELLGRIMEIALRCHDDLHLYVKFYGD